MTSMLRWGTLAAGAACALALSGCVVTPVDGAYYGNAYTTVSTPGVAYDTPYYGYPSYGYAAAPSLWIGSSATYVYGGRSYYRPGYRPGNWGPGPRPGGPRPGFGGAPGRPGMAHGPGPGGPRPGFGGGGHRR